MKNVLIFTLFMILSGCLSQKQIVQTPSKTVDAEISGKTSFWFDIETGTVHKMSSEIGAAKIVSVIKFKTGTPLEMMKIISSGNIGGKLHWIYFVPSTKYIVEITAATVTDREISFIWKNRNAKGEEKTGSDILVRCNELGVKTGKENSNDSSFPNH